MLRYKWYRLVVIGVVSAVFFGLSAQPRHGMMGQGNMRHGTMMGDTVGRCSGGMMGMNMISPQKVIETKDGGFLVVVGNTLIKLDSKLKEQARTVVEPDLEKTSELMMQWREMCPMMKSGASDESGEKAGDEGQSEE